MLLFNDLSFLPIPRTEDWRRYCRDIMHWLFLDKTIKPYDKEPTEVAMPKNVCSSTASSSSPSSKETGTYMNERVLLIRQNDIYFDVSNFLLGWYITSLEIWKSYLQKRIVEYKLQMRQMLLPIRLYGRVLLSML